MAQLQAVGVVDHAAVGEHLAVASDRERHHHHAGTSELRPPTEVDVVAPETHLGVEATNGVKQVGAHQDASPRHREHVGHRVALALIDLAFVGERCRHAELVDREADVLQPGRVVPHQEFRGDNPRVRPDDLVDEVGDGLGRERDVVVAQQQQRGTRALGEHTVRSGAVPRIFGTGREHRRAGQHRVHTRRHVDRGGVDHQHLKPLVVLRGERGEDIVEPVARVMGDHDGEDRRSGRGRRRIRRCGLFDGCDACVVRAGLVDVLHEGATLVASRGRPTTARAHS
ncbi:unannotated protein [freshwater metagenome]|uniref:Unannotated protein n=1 Tax=freshwater metagenome TaxID=449393 RepID=A0A6J6VXS5_9ZZZZ